MAIQFRLLRFLALGLGLMITVSCASKKPASNQKMVARMEVKEPIPGVCDNDNVLSLALMSMLDPSSKDAKCSVTEAEMEKKLNEEVTFLKENPDFSGKGMVSIIVNCKGEAVKCEIDNKSESPELDAQILAVFKTFTSWKAGSVDGTPVDCVQLFSYTIENGALKM